MLDNSMCTFASSWISRQKSGNLYLPLSSQSTLWSPSARKWSLEVVAPVAWITWCSGKVHKVKPDLDHLFLSIWCYEDEGPHFKKGRTKELGQAEDHYTNRLTTCGNENVEASNLLKYHYHLQNSAFLIRKLGVGESWPELPTNTFFLTEVKVF